MFTIASPTGGLVLRSPRNSATPPAGDDPGVADNPLDGVDDPGVAESLSPTAPPVTMALRTSASLGAMAVLIAASGSALAWSDHG